MNIKEFVDGSIAENKVVIFSKTWCPFCTAVKGLFRDNFPNVIPYVIELNEQDDGSAIQSFLEEKTGQRTVPNVFVSQQHVGGSDDTTASFKSGKLAKLIAE